MSVHLMREIDRLKRQILELCAMVEDQLQKAVEAYEKRDPALAAQVERQDVEVDHVEVDVEEECLKILALHQPVAIDLRFIIAVLKINSDLERIGDLAVNIAEQTAFLPPGQPVIPFEYTAMSGRAQSMLKKSLDALVNLDASLARQVCAADDEVDALYREAIAKAKTAIRANATNLDTALPALMVSRHLERVADHATNIAEDIIYMIDGHIVRHKTEMKWHA
jgi:phosphate transport system protein